MTADLAEFLDVVLVPRLNTLIESETNLTKEEMLAVGALRQQALVVMLELFGRIPPEFGALHPATDCVHYLRLARRGICADRK